MPWLLPFRLSTQKKSIFTELILAPYILWGCSNAFLRVFVKSILTILETMLWNNRLVCLRELLMHLTVQMINVTSKLYGSCAMLKSWAATLSHGCRAIMINQFAQKICVGEKHEAYFVCSIESIPLTPRKNIGVSLNSRLWWIISSVGDLIGIGWKGIQL